MKILAFSINPVFPEKVTGGSTKHLKNVMIHLAQAGHEVVILCTRYPEHKGEFRIHANALVKPVLDFHQPYPQPYAIPAYALANILETIGTHLRWADRFYLHDGELLFPHASRIIPTTVSLRDNVYPETIVGGFLFQADHLIAIAEYSRQVILATAGQFLPGLAEHTIPNGLDFASFCPGAPHPNILRLVPVNPRHDLIVLHPHRPERSKGLQQTIDTAALLVHQYGFHNLKVCVPRWFEAEHSPEVATYYREIELQLSERGLTKHFVFHGWIPQAMMPSYYRLGRLTLTLGHFVEAFGNVAYESLACGTPGVVARVGPHRSLLPDELLAKVHFGQADEAAQCAAEILQVRQPTAPQTQAYLREHFSIQKQLNGYAETILHSELQPALTYQFPTPQANDVFSLAPWCYRWAGGIFHDFKAVHQRIPVLETLLARFPNGFTAQQAGMDLAEWVRAGWLIRQGNLDTGVKEG
jgi:glycosyltransferase involved in cell wall biosynthesis